MGSLPSRIVLGIIVSGALLAFELTFGVFGNLLANDLQTKLGFNWVHGLVLAMGLGTVAWLAWNWFERERLQREFACFKQGSSLRPSEFGFRVVEPGITYGDPIQRPFWKGTYISRKARYIDRVQDNVQQRTFDENGLRTLLEEGESFVLVGRPTDGKTRTLFEVLSKLRHHVVVAPKLQLPSQAAIDLLQGKDVICFFDDINLASQRGVDLQGFFDAVREAAASCVVAGTTQDGLELDELLAPSSSAKRLFQGISFRLRLDDPTEAQKSELLNRMPNPVIRPYFSLGSICMNQAFERMRDRFRVLGASARDTLNAVQLLAVSGMDPASRKRLSLVLSEVFGSRADAAEIRADLAVLHKLGFLQSRETEDPVVGQLAFMLPPEVSNYFLHRNDPRSEISLVAKVLGEDSDYDGMACCAAMLHVYARNEEAIELLVQVEEGIGESAEQSDKRIAAMARKNLAVILHRLGDEEKEILVWNKIIARYQGESEPEILEKLALAYLNKGVILARRGNTREAIVLWRELLRRFQALASAQFEEIVANAMSNLAKALQRRGHRGAKKLAMEMLGRYDKLSSPSVRISIGEAFATVGVAMLAEEGYTLAAAWFHKMVERFEREGDPKVLQFAAGGLRNEAVATGMFDPRSALEILNQLDSRYGQATSPLIRRHVAYGAFLKGKAHYELKEFPLARERFTEAIARFVDDADPGIAETVEMVRQVLANETYWVSEDQLSVNMASAAGLN
ncbi:hypothetical protein [Ideonella sp.]|uniref:hypothetical protein n=1 Tax=Ideonella sp. TaxID=1929293 RepID=UPI0035AE8DD0